MLTPFDDYPIHQTPLPVAHPASGDPNHYDRFWFNGYTEDFYFAAGMAVLGPPDASYRKVAKENQSGRLCDVYEERLQSGSSTRIARVWLDPKDGLPVVVNEQDLKLKSGK